jgi:hypothetical protein
MAGPSYCDLEGGNDANTGLSFAQRRKTFNAMTAANGPVRVMASPDPTLVDSTGAAWTQYSKTVTLSGSVTQMIADCESVWTAASGNVTAGTDNADFKEGTKAAQLIVAGAFTTGIAAYFATGTLDLSGYQQVSFWIKNSAAVASSTLSLRLCSDVAGATPVDNIVIPALPSSQQYTAVTVDTAGALGSSIKSVALYCDLDPGAITILLDDIIACKASSSADSLTLTSLIGKISNLSWVASTSYAQNDRRRPTQANRNGFEYRKTNAGSHSSGSSEPTWPTELGVSVTDGSVTWICHALEDTWLPIQAINGTTVKIDGSVVTTGGNGMGYAGATETVATYKREPINAPMTGTDGTFYQLVGEPGTQAAPFVFSGGWNRTDMSTQTGETWVAMQNGRSTLITTNSKNFVTLQNFGTARGYIGIACVGGIGVQGAKLQNTHAVGGNGACIAISSVFVTMLGVNASNSNANNGNIDATDTSGKHLILNRVTMDSNCQVLGGPGLNGGFIVKGHYVRARNNSRYGWQCTPGSTRNPGGQMSNWESANNGTAAIDIANVHQVLCFNSTFGEATPFFTVATADNQGIYAYSIRHQQTANNHYIQRDNASCASATDQRHTASGISWKFTLTSTKCGVLDPFELRMPGRAVQSGVALTIKIWTRRDSTDVTGAICIRGGQVAGVPDDVMTVSTVAINSWLASDGSQITLTVTPTEDGVIEPCFLVWNTGGATTNFWIDDITFP